MRLEQAWRWYGPNDNVSLADIKQAGATGIVSALHEVPTGEVWTINAIKQRQAEVAAAGLVWSVVESVPVHETIKQGADGRDRYIANYQQTIRHLGACGIRKLAYNFMPVIDWTRTELDRVWHDGSKALAFDYTDFVAFEIHILKRPGAEAHFGPAQASLAAVRFASMAAARVEALTQTVIAGMPGRMVEAYTLAEFQLALDAYKDIDHAGLRANLCYFLTRVVPVAEEAGVVLAIHPDDPPLPLLGLPRVVSTEDDVKHVLGAVDSRHNGLTFCVGSYGSSADNDVEGMAERRAVHAGTVRPGLCCNTAPWSRLAALRAKAALAHPSGPRLSRGPRAAPKGEGRPASDCQVCRARALRAPAQRHQTGRRPPLLCGVGPPRRRCRYVQGHEYHVQGTGAPCRGRVARPRATLPARPRPPDAGRPHCRQEDQPGLHGHRQATRPRRVEGADGRHCPRECRRSLAASGRTCVLCLSCCVSVSRGTGRGLSTTSAQRCPRAAPRAARVARGQDSGQLWARYAVARCRARRGDRSPVSRAAR